MKVILTDCQVEFARELAKKRHEAKNISFKNSGILTNTRKTTLVEEYIYSREHKPHFLGLLGEIAYASITGQKIDTKIYSVRDSGFDVGNVEIKTSTWMGSGVELKIKKQEFEQKHPDKYVLARIDENKFFIVELVGQISRRNFDRFKSIKQYKPNNPINYVVGVNCLTSI
jgi:hypothetical protein